MSVVNFDAIHATLSKYLNKPRWLIAYSGGMDSHVLLHVCANYLSKLQTENKRANVPVLTVLHVNHGLQSDSDNWAKHCQLQAQRLGVDCLVEAVQLSQSAVDDVYPSANDSGLKDSIEMQARNARYRVFEKYLDADSVIFLGHHQNDQAETVLHRLIRGSGVKGLAGMPKERALGEGVLSRPLLDTSRLAVEKYAWQYQLEHIDDPSNLDEIHERNFLRQSVVPLLASRWPSVSDTVHRSAQHCREADQLLGELAQQDLFDADIDYLWSLPNVSVDALSLLNEVRVKNVLRYWFASMSWQLPSDAILQQVIQQCVYGSSATQPIVTWHQYSCRVYDRRLYAIKDVLLSNDCLQSEYLWSLQQGDNQLRMRGVGELSLSVQSSSELPATLAIRLGKPQDAFYLQGRDGRRQFNKMMQEWRVPPWWRHRLPLAYHQEQLLMLADKGVTPEGAECLSRLGVDVSTILFNPLL